MKKIFLSVMLIASAEITNAAPMQNGQMQQQSMRQGQAGNGQMMPQQAPAAYNPAGEDALRTCAMAATKDSRGMPNPDSMRLCMTNKGFPPLPPQHNQGMNGAKPQQQMPMNQQNNYYGSGVQQQQPPIR